MSKARAVVTYPVRFLIWQSKPATGKPARITYYAQRVSERRAA